MNNKQKLIDFWNGPDYGMTEIRLMDPQDPEFRPAEPFMSFKPIRYAFEYQGVVHMIVIAARRFTDMASIPRPLWFLIHPLQLDPRAVVIHDEVIKNKGQFRHFGTAMMLRVRSTVDFDTMDATEMNSDDVWLQLSVDWTRAQTDAFFFRVMREAMETRWTIPAGKDPERVKWWWRQRRRWSYRAVRLWVNVLNLFGKDGY